MNTEILLSIILSLGWLFVVGSALASYRLHWSQLAKMGLSWLAIFLGLFLIVQWFTVFRTTASDLI